MSDHPTGAWPDAVDTARRVLTAQGGDCQDGGIGAAVDLMVAACLAQDAGRVPVLAADLARLGFDARCIAEEVVPETARVLGDMWCRDTLNFVGVTIGCARLHGLLRSLSPAWHGPPADAEDAASVLVIGPPDSSHTLGPAVLAGHLRRRGVSVHALVGSDRGQIEVSVKRRRYDAVMISASHHATLDGLRRLVDTVRTGPLPRPMVILGGTLLSEPGADAGLIAALTGADHVTDDIDAALRLCGCGPVAPALGRRA